MRRFISTAILAIMAMATINANGTATPATLNSNVSTQYTPSNNITATAIFRSGTPDAATCASTELFSNEIAFSANSNAAGYIIYRNGEKVADIKAADCNAINGTITYTDEVEDSPIAVGETEAEDMIEYSYSVVGYDAQGNTFGGNTSTAEYYGTASELAVLANEASAFSRISYSSQNITISNRFDWTLYTDAQPIKYAIYRKMDAAANESSDNGQAAFTWIADVAGNENSFCDEINYARSSQSDVIADDEVRNVTYYIKAIYSTDTEVAQNIAEKNSQPFSIAVSETVITGINEANASQASVEANGSQIIVNGAIGTITVYNAAGQVVASANAAGEQTIIAADGFSGICLVAASNIAATKVIVK